MVKQPKYPARLQRLVEMKIADVRLIEKIKDDRYAMSRYIEELESDAQYTFTIEDAFQAILSWEFEEPTIHEQVDPVVDTFRIFMARKIEETARSCKNWVECSKQINKDLGEAIRGYGLQMEAAEQLKKQYL